MPAPSRRRRKQKQSALQHQPKSSHANRPAKRVPNPRRPKTDKQITVHLMNKPGEMAKLTGYMQKAKVNILAMSVSELSDTGAIRMIVDRRKEALAALKRYGIKHSLRDVLLVRADNAAGSLAEISGKLSKAKVNLDYAYGSTAPDAPEALIILAVDNVRKAQHALL